MTAARIAFGVLHAALLIGCSNQKPAERPSDNCHVPLPGNRHWFAGTRECMRMLPQRRMSGVWVRGMEHSVFYEGATQVPENALSSDDLASLRTDVWLDTDPEDLLERSGFRFDGTAHAYRIDFIGTKSDADGGYGHAGMFRHGALVLRILKIEEIPVEERE